MPRRKRPSAESIAASERAKAQRRTRVVGAIVATALGLWVIGRAVPERVEGDLPADPVFGVWRSDDSRYADRALVVTSDSVGFGVGEGVTIFYPVESIVGRANEEHTEYVITYVGSAGTEMIQLFVDATGEMRLKNPPEVRWSRTGPA